MITFPRLRRRQGQHDSRRPAPAMAIPAPDCAAAPAPPSLWDQPDMETLQSIADSLRNLDGPAAPGYRAARSAVRTVPFQALREQTPPPPRYAAPRPLPGLAADLTDLPLFRETVAMRTRRHAGECLCGRGIAGDTWGGRMVTAGAHLLGGAS